MQQQQQYAEERGLLGKLCPGEKKLEGKTFYLDNVKKRPTTLLIEAISLLGGRVEGFLHKDVSFVVTGSEEGLKEQSRVVTEAATKRTEEPQHPVKKRDSVLSKDKPRPGTPKPMACGSRGKALLEKAIRNNERLQASSVLTNARSWGVKILYVDDVLLYLKQLNSESLSTKHKRPEKTSTQQQRSHVVKAAPLRSPYLKIEDSSRKYKPLNMQSMSFPTLCYSGRYSPFESPPPPFKKQKEQGENKTREKCKLKSSIKDKSQTSLSFNPPPWRPRKKDLTYCECCYQPFANLEEHLQSDHHRAFVLDSSNYCVLDQLVAEMLPGFNPNPSQESEEFPNRPPSLLCNQDVCELEPITDAEMERTIQLLRRQGSFSSPTRGPLISASTSPEDPLPDSHHATSTPDIQLLVPKCPFPDSQSHGSIPTMPVLHVEPQTHSQASQQPENLTTCSNSQFPSLDPYSLPPVLSPHPLVSDDLMEQHSSYSEPPVLSPQNYTTEDTFEMDTQESVSESVPVVLSSIATPPFLSVAVSNVEGVEGSNPEALLGLSGVPYTSNGLKCEKLSPPGSHSLPWQSVTSPNPKKRCKFSLFKPAKRTRKASFCHSDCWPERGNTDSDIMTMRESCLSVDMIQSCSNSKVSTCNVFGLKHQPISALLVPTVQNFSQEPNQIDILGHSSTSVADQPSLSLSSEVKKVESPLQFPNNNAHGVFSSQDYQQSLSLSTSVCIESVLIPDIAKLSPSSSDSDWDCELLSRLDPTPAPPPMLPNEQSYELDKELLHRPCTWMHDTSYESRLHTVLQPSPPGTSLCGEEMDPSAFSRTVVQIVQVQN